MNNLWFPIWAADLMLDRKINDLEFHELGMLLKIWCLICRQTCISFEPKIIAKQIGCEWKIFKKTWPKLEQFLDKTESGFISNRMQEELSIANSNSNSKSRAGKASAEARKAKKREKQASEQATYPQQNGNTTSTERQQKSNKSQSQSHSTENPNGFSEGAATAPPPPEPEKPKPKPKKPDKPPKRDPGFFEILEGKGSQKYKMFWRTFGLWEDGTIHNHTTLAKTWIEHCTRYAAPDDLLKGFEIIFSAAEDYYNTHKKQGKTQYMKNPLAWLTEEAYVEYIAKRETPDLLRFGRVSQT